MTRAKIRSPFRIVMSLLVIWIAAVVVVPASARAAHAVPREWTVLIFMNGKNNLEEFAIEDFEELAKVGGTDKVSFVVQMGRPLARPDGQDVLEEVYGGWSGVRRFEVGKGDTPATGEEIEIVGGYEVDMGAPETLEAFLKWGKVKFPAKRYAVVVWNHGQGYRLMNSPGGTRALRAQTSRELAVAPKPSHRAISEDADTGNIIYNSDLRASLDASFDQDLALVGFDACLMGMLETAYELKDVAPVMVASEELEPGRGWNYATLAQALVAAPQSDATALAEIIVQSYRDNYRDTDETTLSTVRTDRVEPIAAELSALSDMLMADSKTLFPLVTAARTSRAAYNRTYNPVTIDLIGFADALEQEISAKAPGSPALAQVRKVRDAAKAAVVESYASSLRGEPWGSYGIAIYFPVSKRAFYKDPFSEGYLRSNEHKPIAFVGKERWADFLATFLEL